MSSMMKTDEYVFFYLYLPYLVYVLLQGGGSFQLSFDGVISFQGGMLCWCHVVSCWILFVCVEEVLLEEGGMGMGMYRVCDLENGVVLLEV